MRFPSLNLPIFILALASTALVDVAFAEGRPGDEFRHAADAYEHQVTDAVNRASEADGEAVGRYMQLATIFQEMAGIKRRAASLADVERWDKITWDRYKALERRRDAILDELEGHHAPEIKQAHGGGEFVESAHAYREHAEHASAQAREMDGVEQAIYKELAELFNAMAAIKDRAADASRNGDDIDWSRYEALSERRQKLENMLEAAR